MTGRVFTTPREHSISIISSHPRRINVLGLNRRGERWRTLADQVDSFHSDPLTLSILCVWAERTRNDPRRDALCFLASPCREESHATIGSLHDCPWGDRLAYAAPRNAMRKNLDRGAVVYHQCIHTAMTAHATVDTVLRNSTLLRE